jgi:hypothetical protein
VFRGSEPVDANGNLVELVEADGEPYEVIGRVASAFGGDLGEDRVSVLEHGLEDGHGRAPRGYRRGRGCGRRVGHDARASRQGRLLSTARRAARPFLARGARVAGVSFERSMDSKERFCRRRELARSYEPDIRAMYLQAKSQGIPRPIAIIAEATEAWGDALLRGMAGPGVGQRVFVYSAQEVHRAFVDMDPALGRMPAALLDAVKEQPEDSLCIVCLAYTGWSIFRPDAPGGWGPPELADDKPPPAAN